MHAVPSSFANRRTLVAFFALWSVLVAGFYLWSIRGLLGFQSRDHFIIEANSSSGKVDVLCSIQTPIKPNRRNELTCELKAPPTNIVAAPIQVGVAVSGDGFLVAPAGQQIVLKSEGLYPLRFGVEPILSGNQDLLISVNVADAPFYMKRWSLSVEPKPVEIILIPIIVAVILTWLYITFRNQVRIYDQALAQTKAKIEKAEEKAESEPTGIRWHQSVQKSIRFANRLYSRWKNRKRQPNSQAS